jgi:TetR/AcrR family transcriptional regulator, regulator of cefoperazone and chloramphenicol sensitivity
MSTPNTTRVAATEHEEVPLAGYRKGEEARQRILEAALKAFGANGYKGATTRQIAEDAGVNLPALTYYFGGKEGLYNACAREIVSRYEKRMLTLVAGAHAELGRPMKPAEARTRLKQVMAALAAMLVGAEETEIWSAFVLREMAERGPAFAVLYEQLWAPGVDLTAGLISRAMGERTTSTAARIHALLLISSLSAFSTARPVALKYLKWPDANDERFARIRQILDQQIDRIGGA